MKRDADTADRGSNIANIEEIEVQIKKIDANIADTDAELEDESK